jgi:hypothetical protein
VHGAVVTAVDPLRGPSEPRTYSTVATKVEHDGGRSVVGGMINRAVKKVFFFLDRSDGDR